MTVRADPPLVSVITPTWQRHELLTCRCIPSVLRQTYPRVEHVIVSDGDEYGELYPKILAAAQGSPSISYHCLPDHHPDRHWGGRARRHGIAFAHGELIAYCDDDDALRPEHAGLLATALLEHQDTDWAYSQMVSHQPAGPQLIGAACPPNLGGIGTPMIMHRRGLIAVANWDADGLPVEDWHLVDRWLKAGTRYAHVEQPTVDVWPSGQYG